MTDEEILKAFQLCNTDTDCDTNGCPYNDMVEDCISMLNNDIISRFNELKAENAALRSATQYLIDDGGADCCAKCIYCPQPTEEDDDCLCHHGGDCVDGVTKWFMQNG